MLKKSLLSLMVVFVAIASFAQQQFTPASTAAQSAAGSFAGAMGLFTPPDGQLSGSSVDAIVVFAEDHQHTLVTDKPVDATCTNSGLTSGQHCSVCGEVITAQTTIPALGHKIAIDMAVDSTTTPPNVVAAARCPVCGKILVSKVVFPIRDSIVKIDTTIAVDGLQVRIDTTIVVNWSTFQDTTIIIGTGAVDIAASAVKVYPNPVANELTIDADDNSICFIYDTDGHLIMKRKVEKGKPINVSQLTSGCYVLQIVTNSKTINSINIIKQ